MCYVVVNEPVLFFDDVGGSLANVRPHIEQYGSADDGIFDDEGEEVGRALLDGIRNDARVVAPVQSDVAARVVGQFDHADLFDGLLDQCPDDNAHVAGDEVHHAELDENL